MDNLDGLNPKKDLHDTYVVVEPKLGIPLEHCIRAMGSLVVGERISPVYPSDVQLFRGMVMPLFWLEYVRKFSELLVFHPIFIAAPERVNSDD